MRPMKSSTSVVGNRTRFSSSIRRSRFGGKRFSGTYNPSLLNRERSGMQQKYSNVPLVQTHSFFVHTVGDKSFKTSMKKRKEEKQIIYAKRKKKYPSTMMKLGENKSKTTHSTLFGSTYRHPNCRKEMSRILTTKSIDSLNKVDSSLYHTKQLKRNHRFASNHRFVDTKHVIVPQRTSALYYSGNNLITTSNARVTVGREELNGRKERTNVRLKRKRIWVNKINERIRQNDRREETKRAKILQNKLNLYKKYEEKVRSVEK